MRRGRTIDRAGVTNRAAIREPLARAVASLVVGAVALAACSTSAPPAPPTGASAGQTASTVLAPIRSPTVDLDHTRRQTVAGLIARRAIALTTKDERAWLASVSDLTVPFAARQAQVFARMTQLPITGYGQTAVEVGPPLDAARQRALGADAWVTTVHLTYALQGYDRAPRQFTASYTVSRTPTGWGFVDDADGLTQPQPWDLSPMTVLRSPTTLVIGSAHLAHLKDYLALGDAAHKTIAGVWGSARPGVIVAPATSKELVTALQRDSASGLDQVAAITDGPLDARGMATSDRVYLNPDAFGRLNGQGRRVVVTHELTHVTVRASTTRAVPLWLSEGFADYVGFSGLGLDPRAVAADLLTKVRAGAGPTALPSDTDFDPSRSVIAPVYNAGWLAIGRISSTYGQDRLVAFYRAVAGAAPVDQGRITDPAANAKAAFPAVLGISEDAFTADWLAELRRLAG